MQFSSPSSAFGAYRGAPQAYQDTGSGAGNQIQGTGSFGIGMGPVVASGNAFVSGSTSSNTGSAWSPTLLYLFVLIVAEMFIFGILARHL